MQNSETIEQPRLSKYDYFLVTLLIILSGHPIMADRYYFALAGIFAVGFLIFKGVNRSLSNIKWYCAVFITISVAQLFLLGSVSYLGVANMLMKITFGFLVFTLLGDRFRYAYTNILVVVSALSLIFFFLQIAGVSLPVLWTNGGNTNSIYIYNWHRISESIPRNDGIFWEPGAFSAYLLLVPLLYLRNIHALIHDKRMRKKSLILFAAFLTTTSTTGYIVFAIILVYYMATKSGNFVRNILIYVPLVIIPMIYAFNKLDFMGDKMQTQFETAAALDGDYASSRYGAMLFDQHYIMKHPIVGNGIDEKTRFADHPFLWGESLGMGNGLTGFIACWGIIALLFYCVLLYRGLPFTQRERLVFIAIVLLQFNGEYLLNYPLYLALPFVILPSDNCKNNIL